MTSQFNIDEVVKHVKTLADNNRCGVCDKLSGDRLRYSCGHKICGECVIEADECLTCTNSSKTQPVLDPIQGQLVQNVSNLLTTFEEAFNIDVYRRYRLSEKLRIENKLFPECIQASVKYYNKRRCSIRTNDDKENLIQSFFAGEVLNNSHSTTMNTRISLVQKWLEKNEKVQRPVRKPFSDINVNNSIKSNRENKINKSTRLHNQENDLNRKSKKINKERINSKNKKKPKNVLSPSLLNYYKNETKNTTKPENRLNFEKKCDESSILINKCHEYKNNTDDEHLETIVIEDTQTQIVDKDKDAWLKVVEEHNKQSNYNFKDNLKSLQKPLSKPRDELKPDSNSTKKNVYFYKKAYLFKSCYFCISNDFGSIRSENQRLNTNNVSITINTNNISSTITVSRDDEDCNDKVITKHSIETQTDDFNISVEPKHLSPTYENISSPDLFVDDVKKQTDIDNKNINIEDIGITNNSKSHCVISDSDSDYMDFSGPIKVSAEVHSSNDMEGILSAVGSSEYQCRVRRSARRPTVDSNNSSEKENLEPNRIKRRKLGKKQGIKK